MHFVLNKIDTSKRVKETTLPKYKAGETDATVKDMIQRWTVEYESPLHSILSSGSVYAYGANTTKGIRK